MKIQIASDLHLGFYPNLEPMHDVCSERADVLVLAGDLAEVVRPEWRQGLRMACDSFEHVICVLGNHEHYRAGAHGVERAIAWAMNEFSNLHYLENSTVEIDGVIFAGTTLWFEMTAEARLLSCRLNDFDCIFDAWRKIPQWNQKAQEFLATTVADVVVTHHAPSHRSVPPCYSDSPLNCFYVCDQEEIIQGLQPRLWLHGHIHRRCKYPIGGSWVAANPYGYPGEVEAEPLVLDLDDLARS